MKETINQTTLCYDNYKGNDLYCDGAVEDQLLDIVKEHDAAEFDHIIETSSNWPIMYHLSCVRENILGWYPFKKGASILEIGSGCGAVTGSLCKNDNRVVCIDLSKKRSHINAYRHKKEKIEIHVGNFEDIKLNEKFDYVTMIGVLEYGGSYIHADSPYIEFINKAKSYLKPDGKLLIAIENKLGLKYWAGCREDHVGEFFESIEGYPKTRSVKTFTKKELNQLLNKAGFVSNKFFYPYPDYKFAHTIFSNQYLPKRNDCNDNIRNFDQDRMVLFNETNVFNTLIENDMFEDFSNSYFIEAGLNDLDNDIVYTKFSQSNRAKEYQVKTTIYQNAEKQFVTKEAIHEEGKNHVMNMLNSYEILKQNYEDSKMDVASCKQVEDRIEFNFVDGETLESYLDDLAKSGNIKGLIDEIQRYFDSLFVPVKNYEGYMEYANLDALFGNVKKQNDQYCMFDYEWVFQQSVPVEFIKYRCLFYYAQNNPYIHNIDLLSIFGIDSTKQDDYRIMEEQFQNYVKKGKLVDDQLHTQCGKITIRKEDILSTYDMLLKNKTMQVYFDMGKGFSEVESVRIPVQEQGGYRRLEFTLPNGIKHLRIDPMDTYGIVHVEKLLAYHPGKSECIKLNYVTQGKDYGNGHLLFLTDDPVLEITNDNLANMQVIAEFEIWPLSKDTACWMGTLPLKHKLLKGR